MCGILGLIQNHDFSISSLQFEKINMLNFHRGPDVQNTLSLNLSNYKVNLGHTRLSIQDLSEKANQPMKSYTGRYIISFNGEIYNHLSLRKLLESKNFNQWNTNSDTETLLNLFEFYSFSEVLNIIEGMFSFILIDLNEKKIFFARDSAGEKPLYLCFNKLFICASSDLNAIKNIPGFKKNINKSVLSEYLKYNYIPSPNTIFENTFKLPPASYLELDLKLYKFKEFKNFNIVKEENSIKFIKWWNIDKNKKDLSNLDNIEIKNMFHDMLFYSVKSQLISDVPLGAFLSSGIDSSLIVSMMQKIQSNTKTFTIGYENKIYDESNQSKKIAEFLETDHSSYIFSNQEIIKFIKNSSSVFSEPFSDSSQLPTLLVSKLAKQKVKVVLTGDGGDELFGGYNRYIYANKYWKLFKVLRPLIKNQKFLKYLPSNFYKFIGIILNLNLNKNSISKINKKLLNINSQYTYYNSLISEWDRSDEILNFKDENLDDKKIKKIFENNNYLFEEKMMLSDFKTYLPDDILCKVDRSTMYNSLESRAPFLNKSLVESAFSLPLNQKINKGNSKLILKEILSEYLPLDLTNKNKMGFGVPIGDLMKKELNKWTREVLSSDLCNKHNFFNYNVVCKTLNDHLNGKVNNQFKLWSLIQFNLWYENL